MEPDPEVEVNVPGVMPTVVAPEVVHESVADEPEVMFEGLAVNEETTGGAGGGALVTVTVAAAVALPALFVAVRV